MRGAPLRSLLLAGLASALLAAPPLLAATETRTAARAAGPPAGGRVVVENLAGRVAVRSEKRSDVAVTATFTARAKTSAEARELLGLLSVDVEAAGEKLVVHVTFPVERHGTYRYTEETKGLRLASPWAGLATGVTYQGREVTLTTRKEGVELFADLVVAVPSGLPVTVVTGAGRLTAAAVDADLELTSKLGDARVGGGAGALTVTTGNGSVDVERHRGSVRVRAGFGDLRVAGVEGELDAEVDHGDVTLQGVSGPRIRVAAEMGSLRARSVTGALLLSTFSGEVDVSEAALVGETEIGTGSGDLKLTADASRATAVRFSSRSGDVDAVLAALPAARVRATSRGGEPEVLLPGHRITAGEDDTVEADAGTLAPGAERIPVELRSGSGNVRLRVR